jgi:hypothetical protein
LKENFTDSIFAIYKEKEMADFRKWFIVLAMLSLFTGLAAAQTTYGAFTCSTVAQVTPTLRSEGLTELVGDIVLTCTGGNPILAGQPIPQANVIVSLTAPVTSRLQSGSGTTGASEALLLIDEPTAPIAAVVPNFGPQAPISVCASTSGGCVEYAQVVGGIGVASGSATSAVQTFNVFQGLVAGTNQVIFPGVPILPPATAGASRVYRITNIRVNANGAGSSLISGIQPVYAYISTSGSTALPVGNQALTVGFVQTSLTNKGTVVSNPFTQCNPPVSPANVALMAYTENFPSAFKTRVAPLTSTAGSSYLVTNGSVLPPGSGQNVPGQLYNTESGFILPLPSGAVAGLADFGTRFKAVFNNLPTNIKLYVSRTNVTDAATPVADPGSLSTTSFATFTAGGEGAAFAAPAGSTLSNIGTVQVVALPISSGSATAVWEVINDNVAGSETFNFAVYVSYTAAALPSLTPLTGGASVTQSYAPISTVTTAASATVAPLPRFVVGANATTQPIITIVPCQTILLFPYVTTMAGLDTGIAISNTAMDPLSPATLGSTGSCRLYFYGSNLSSTAIVPPTTPPTIGPIAPGNPDYTKAAFLASAQFGSNVTGYMFASCDFQYAHGFAFISDAGLRNLAMGYLALVVTDGTTPLSRVGAQKGETLNN